MKDESKFPLVSIVIPTFNSAMFIDKCLKSVLSTRYPNFEVILVDDKSSDKTLEIVKTFKKRYNSKLRVFVNEKRRLAAATRNIGFAKSKGEFVALLDHDVEVHPNWINEMVKLAQTDKNIGIVQSKVFDIRRRKILQCVGVKIVPFTGWVESIGFGKKDSKSYNKSLEVVGGATGVLYRKKIFERIGGFDEKLGINVDDLDLNWRFWIAGYITKTAPKAYTYHWSKTSKTRDKWLSRFWWEFHYAKIQRVFIKNYSFFSAIKYLPAFFIFSFLRGFKNILFGLNFSPLFGLIVATLWNILNIRDTLSERKNIQSQRVFSDSFLFKKIFFQEGFYFYFFKIWFPIWSKTGKILSSDTFK